MNIFMPKFESLGKINKFLENKLKLRLKKQTENLNSSMTIKKWNQQFNIFLQAYMVLLSSKFCQILELFVT